MIPPVRPSSASARCRPASTPAQDGGAGDAAQRRGPGDRRTPRRAGRPPVGPPGVGQVMVAKSALVRSTRHVRVVEVEERQQVGELVLPACRSSRSRWGRSSPWRSASAKIVSGSRVPSRWRWSSVIGRGSSAAAGQRCGRHEHLQESTIDHASGLSRMVEETFSKIACFDRIPTVVSWVTRQPLFCMDNQLLV